jgi:signal transduction histidine kinase
LRGARVGAAGPPTGSASHPDDRYNSSMDLPRHLLLDVEAIERIGVIPQILAAVSALTGHGFVAVARVTEDRWITCAVLDNAHFGLKPGDELDVQTTLCREVRLAKETVVIDHASKDDRYCRHPTPELYGFESYISVPIVLPDGEFFGTLCSLDKRPAALKASVAPLTLALFADLIAAHLYDARLLQNAQAKNLEIESLLHQSRKMELVGQLTAGLAHDFRNILVVVGGMFELLQRRIEQQRLAELPRYIETGKESVRRATALADRLLAFSRKEESFAHPLDVDTQVLAMEDMVKRTAGNGVTVHFDVASDAGRVVVDPSQFDSALLNLCVNARDAMPNGGVLRIGVSKEIIDGMHALRSKLAAGEYVTIRVTDSGTGMSQEVVSRVLEPFFTTKPSGAGTGLGLSMVAELARQAGGAVDIDSTPGHGTTVSLYLPRADAPEKLSA